jgi:hypothetical protein
MKTLKLVSMAMIAMAITLGSCSGEDGETGPQGPQGVAGTDGTDGVDGQDGQDGNANVQAFDLDISSFGDTSTLNFSLPIASEDLPKYAFLFYIKKSVTNVYYSMPGSLNSNNQYTKMYYDEDNGNAVVEFYNTSDNTDYFVQLGEFSNLRTIAIEVMVQVNKDSAVNVLDELKSAGIDTSDYHAVAAYFGLE